MSIGNNKLVILPSPEIPMENGSDLLSALPLECLQNILGYLPKKSLNCCIEANRTLYHSGWDVKRRQQFELIHPYLTQIDLTLFPDKFFPDWLYPYINGTWETPPTLKQLQTMERFIFEQGRVGLWLLLADSTESREPPKNPNTLDEFLNLGAQFQAWFKRNEEHLIATVKRVHLKGIGFKYLPKEFYRLKNLKEIDLSGNRIEGFPEELGNLKGLKFIDLSNNPLHTLPKSFSSLSKLELLNIARTDFTKLPSQIGELPNLSRLLFPAASCTHRPLLQYRPSTFDGYFPIPANWSQQDFDEFLIPSFIANLLPLFPTNGTVCLGGGEISAFFNKRAKNPCRINPPSTTAKICSVAAVVLASYLLIAF